MSLEKFLADELKHELDRTDEDELMALHNQHCEEANDPDDRVYHNDDELFQMYFNTVDNMELLRAVEYGDYSIHHKYVKFNGLGNLESANDVSSLIDITELAEDIAENPEKYKDVSREIFDFVDEKTEEYEEENEDEDEDDE